MFKFGIQVVLILAAVFMIPWLLNEPVLAQTGQESSTEDIGTLLKNGSIEETVGTMPQPWMGRYISIDTEHAFEGKQSLLMDTREMDVSIQRSFAAMSQRLDATSLRGKNIRFRAYVKTADRTDDAKAMLWLRVDKKDKNGKPTMALIDNMMDRPITTDEWEPFDIVVKVDDEAESISLGMIVSGRARAWFDNATLEEVSEEVKPTTVDFSNAPKQPFWNAWMILALLGAGLMVVSQTSNNPVQRYALKFAIVYWVLYSFSDLVFGSAMRIVGSLQFFEFEMNSQMAWLAEQSANYQKGVRSVGEWFGAKFLGLNNIPNIRTGSGDTTFDWVRIFSIFCISIFSAVVWSLVWRSKDDNGQLRDLLRTWLRYTLAIVLLGYGLAKASFISTQFAVEGLPYPGQLDRTYGESSPMGLLWTFMAASPSYTFFAGVMEVIPALLLLFRRTAVLGAVLAFAVMANVAMLNMCYDVPVKQYSMHLAFMAVIILLPETRRLMDLFVLNRQAEPSDMLRPPFEGSKLGRWAHGIGKAVLLFLIFAIPVYGQVKREFTEERKSTLDVTEHQVLDRGFRWISELPYNR